MAVVHYFFTDMSFIWFPLHIFYTASLNPTPGNPSVKFLSYKRPLIGKAQGWRGIDGGWLLRRQRNRWGGSSRSMGHR